MELEKGGARVRSRIILDGGAFVKHVARVSIGRQSFILKENPHGRRNHESV